MSLLTAFWISPSSISASLPCRISRPQIPTIMATVSYRLETPKPRPPPVPIRTTNISPPPSRASGNRDTARPLLYDLPAVTPTSPQFSTSPTSPTGRSQSRASRTRGMTPPPHNRAPTPSRPLEKDLETFAAVCRAW